MRLETLEFGWFQATHEAALGNGPFALLHDRDVVFPEVSPQQKQGRLFVVPAPPQEAMDLAATR